MIAWRWAFCFENLTCQCRDELVSMHHDGQTDKWMDGFSAYAYTFFGLTFVSHHSDVYSARCQFVVAYLMSLILKKSSEVSIAISDSYVQLVTQQCELKTFQKSSNQSSNYETYRMMPHSPVNGATPSILWSIHYASSSARLTPLCTAVWTRTFQKATLLSK